MTHAIAIGPYCSSCRGPRADVRLFRERFAFCPACRMAARRGNVLGSTALHPNVAEGMAAVLPLRPAEPVCKPIPPAEMTLAELDAIGGAK